MAIKFTEEISLVTRLLVRDKKVPEKMKAKALEQISLMLMEYEEGDAFWYILDELYKSIESEDKKALAELAELALHTLENSGSKGYSKPEFEKLEQICLKASNLFVEEQDNAARAAMVSKLADEDLLMVYYSEGFMLFYCDGFRGFIAAGLNGRYSKNQLIEKVDTMPGDQKAEITSLIHRAFDINTTEIKFADLSYDLYADGQLMLKLQEV